MPLSRKHFRRSRDAPGFAEADPISISADHGKFNYIDARQEVETQRAASLA